MAASGTGESEIPVFKSRFAVQLHCDGCGEEIRKALEPLDGIQEVTANVGSQTVEVVGSTAPSLIVQAIEATGRDAIIRGSGAADSAAVCILELHDTKLDESSLEQDPKSNGVSKLLGQSADLGRGSRYQGLYVKGLIRLVEVAKRQVAFDVALTGLTPGAYDLNIQQTGDISRGVESTGATLQNLGQIQVSQEGSGNAFFIREMSMWEPIGHAMVLKSPTRSQHEAIVGVVARSAGAWENNKTVCACSGMTVWEERATEKQRGVL